MRIVCEVDGREVAVTLGPDRPEVLLGRHGECDLRVKNPSVSRRHARFVWKGGQVEVIDNGSTTGTFVNGRKVQSAVVTADDAVSCGTQGVFLHDTGGGGGAVPLDDPFSSGGAVPLDDDPFSSGVPVLEEPAPAPAGGGGGSSVDDFFSGGSSGVGKDGVPLLDDYEPPPELKREGRGRREPKKKKEAPKRQEEPEDIGSRETFELHYTGPDGQPATFVISPVAEPAVLGRRSDCTVYVKHPTVGRQHCRIGWMDNCLQVHDLKSSNGTFLNGKRVRREPLKDGDEVMLGGALITVRLQQTQRLEEDDDGWSDDWDDDWDDGDTVSGMELEPPPWHLIYVDGDDHITVLTMSLTQRVIAVGTDRDCEIRVQAAGVESEHCEITWDQGIIVVRDLGTEAGTLLRGKAIEERVARNNETIECGELKIRVRRGAADVQTKQASQRFDEWTSVLARRDEGMSLIFIVGDEDDLDIRYELTIWGDGEGSLERFELEERTSHDAVVAQPVLDLLFGSLIQAGFPSVPTDQLDDDEEPIEIEVYNEGDSAVAVLGRRAMNRSEHYQEAVELLRAVLEIALERA